jgi:glycosyltransferase involved in cell wall biosynthesis
MASVSAIIIFLNAEAFIEEAIRSVFSQTHCDWELLLVDDGSNDASSSIARRYAERHPERVRYVAHEGHQNHGMSASRNLGLRLACGDYVALLDADDVWLPEKLAYQVRILEAHPEVGMVCGASRYWYGWTGRPEDRARDVTVNVGAPQDAVAQPPALALLLYPLSTGRAPCVASLLIRRRAVEMVGGFEQSFRGLNQRYEDQAFLAKMYLTFPVYVSSACLDLYRRHDGACTADDSRSMDYHAARYFFLQWYDGLLRDYGYRRSVVRYLLWTALWPYQHPFVAYLWRESVRGLSRVAYNVLPSRLYSRLRELRHTGRLISVLRATDMSSPGQTRGTLRRALKSPVSPDQRLPH